MKIVSCSCSMTAPFMQWQSPQKVSAFCNDWIMFMLVDCSIHAMAISTVCECLLPGLEQSTSMNRIQSWQKALTDCGDCHCMNGAVNKHEQDPILAEGTHRLLNSPCMNRAISRQCYCTCLSGYSHPKCTQVF